MRNPIVPIVPFQLLAVNSSSSQQSPNYSQSCRRCLEARRRGDRRTSRGFGPRLAEWGFRRSPEREGEVRIKGNEIGRAHV